MPHLCTCETSFLILFVFLISSILHHHPPPLHRHALILDRLLAFLTAFSMNFTAASWQRVMDQMGPRKLMGHMRHGSEGVDPWPIIFERLCYYQWQNPCFLEKLHYRISHLVKKAELTRKSCPNIVLSLTCLLFTKLLNVLSKLALLIIFPEMICLMPTSLPTAKNHSTETALLYIHNHLIDAIVLLSVLGKLLFKRNLQLQVTSWKNNLLEFLLHFKSNKLLYKLLYRYFITSLKLQGL